MFRAVTITGSAGSVRWGSAPVATLSGWTMTKIPGGWSLSAAASSVDHFRASQQPLMLVVPHEGGSWRWPVQTLQVDGQAVIATLGPRG